MADWADFVRSFDPTQDDSELNPIVNIQDHNTKPILYKWHGLLIQKIKPCFISANFLLTGGNNSICRPA